MGILFSSGGIWGIIPLDNIVRMIYKRGNDMWRYYCIPILIELLLLPLWFLQNMYNGYSVALLEILLHALVIPIYLIIVSYISLKKFRIKSLVLLLIMIGLVLVENLMGYFNWGFTTGYLFHPDSETVLLCETEIVVALIIVTVGWICLVKFRKIGKKH